MADGSPKNRSTPPKPKSKSKPKARPAADLGLVEIERRASSQRKGKPDYEVIIVGAGFAGMGAAIELQKNDIDSFVILERAKDVGGTWRDNRYPGIAVDISSFVYSFSYEQNPNCRAFSRPVPSCSVTRSGWPPNTASTPRRASAWRCSSRCSTKTSICGRFTSRTAAC